MEKIPPSKSNQNADCPICLGEIEDPTGLNCTHRFCFACISSWTRQRNRCPVCRSVITSIRHFVQDDITGKSREQEIAIQEPLSTRPFILNMGFYFFVKTSPDSPLFVVQPLSDQHNCNFYYSTEMLERDRHYYLNTVRSGTMFVVPENVFRVVDILEAADIQRYNPQPFEHWNMVHPNYFRIHGHHGRIDQQQQQPR